MEYNLEKKPDDKDDDEWQRRLLNIIFHGKNSQLKYFTDIPRSKDLKKRYQLYIYKYRMSIEIEEN